jgi:hypothetical protein
LSCVPLIFPKFYLPKDNIVSKSKKDGANYLAWEKAGYLTLLDGDVIDYDYIYEDILAIDKEIDLEELIILLLLCAISLRCIMTTNSLRIGEKNFII